MGTKAIVYLLSISHWKLTPYRILLLGFVVLIFIGTFLLMLPIAAAPGRTMSLIDALFMATSAVCVTGLAVVDTGTHFSVFGQIVIILLVQVGAFGFMTLTTLMAVLMRKKIQLKERLVIQEELNQLTLSDIVRLTMSVIQLTLVLEFIGGTLLALRFYQEFGVAGIYMGYWHAISAFCNAGFDIFSTAGWSTGVFVDDYVVNLVIPLLTVTGGLGFYVWLDLWRKRRFREFSLQSKIVLTTTAALILLETIGIFLLEYDNMRTMGNLSLQGQVFASYFQATASRTSGFSTLPVGEMADATLFFITIFMFIGASPGSTGSGIKTTTFAVIVASIWGLIRGHNDPVLFYRRISQGIVHKAFAIFFTAAALVVTITMALSISEKFSFIQILFEVVSAFSTTGLSTGITGDLSTQGKLGLIWTMFVGRVGPITFALALAMRSKRRLIQYPEEKITIG